MLIASTEILDFGESCQVCHQLGDKPDENDECILLNDLIVKQLHVNVQTIIARS